MKNLFKTLITVITVVCMLSSMTAFAATQTTVTTYNSDTSVNVLTTVSGIAADTIVTYLVADDVNNNKTADAGEIKYINQATANGTDAIKFGYAIAGEHWAAGKAIADVKFGSDDAAVAGELNDDVVMFKGIEFIVKNTDGAEVKYAAELSEADFIGKGDYDDNAVITALPGFDIVSVKIGDVTYADGTEKPLQSAYKIGYEEKVEVTVSAITTTKVYLFEGEATDGYDVYDSKTGLKLEVITGIGYYVGGPVQSAAIVFEGIDVDGAHDDYTYDAVVGDEVSGYFAVQLAQADAFPVDAKATCAHVVANGELVESSK